MELRRFYVYKEAVQGSYVAISGEEYNHIVKVLRYKRGYSFIACDGSGKDYLCKIVNITPDIVEGEICDIMDNDTEAAINVTLYLGAIKNEKLTIAVQKAVEIGVKSIALFSSANTSEKDVNTARLKKIAVEASKQCGRASVPVIEDRILRFDEVIKRGKNLIMAYEKERSTSLASLTDKLRNSRDLGVIIGSEGGFKPYEAEAAIESGVSMFSLGRRILRAETAAIVSLGYLIQQLDISNGQ